MTNNGFNGVPLPRRIEVIDQFDNLLNKYKLNVMRRPSLKHNSFEIVRNNYENKDLSIACNKNIKRMYLRFNNIPSYISNFIKDFNDYEIIIPARTNSEFNNLCSLLKNIPIRNKRIFIDISNIDNIYNNIRLDFELLPSYVKVSPFGFENNDNSTELLKECDLINPYKNTNAFSTWVLWLNDTDYNLVIDKFTHNSREYYMKLKGAIKHLYNNMPNNIASDIEKTNYIYNWIKQNITYQGEVTNRDGSLNYRHPNASNSQDPLYTLINKKGVCAGQARLMKHLLNNRLMKVNCFLETGYVGHLQHIWTYIITDYGNFRYDTTLNNKCMSEDVFREKNYRIGEYQISEDKKIIKKNLSLKGRY